jgi:very-short-patch-repair endonuclease
MRMYSSSTAEYFGGCIGRCLSPIEQHFLSALFFMTDNAWAPSVYSPTIAFDLHSSISLQVQVPVEQYKVDFVMVTRYKRRFAIEIDGYTYHGATPKQFSEDSARQRFITGLGYTFLRFSGQEVESDPVKVAREALKHVRDASLAGAQAKKERLDAFGAMPWEKQIEILARATSRARADQGLATREENEITDEELVALGIDWRGHQRRVTKT